MVVCLLVKNLSLVLEKTNFLLNAQSQESGRWCPKRQETLPGREIEAERVERSCILVDWLMGIEKL